MKVHRFKQLPLYLTLFWLLGSFVVAWKALAETNNPFGNVDPQPPAGGEITPPPPEEDEFDAKGDFGFNPPPPVSNNQNTPPAPQNRARTGPPPKPNTAPPSNPQALGSTPLPSPRARGSSTAVTQPSKPTQKLADYLELDSSVKGLEVKNFDLPDKELKDVVTMISKWTGKNFILDSKVRGKITIMGPSQVTLQEAYQAFLSALEANGFTTVQSGKFIRIIESAEARRAPVKTYSGDYAPKDDQFITRIFQLKYINSDEVQREFRDLTTRQGKLFAYEPTNSIIITDTGSNIQRIRDILETLDVKNFETTLHVLRIKNSSAKTISDMLGAIYGEDKAGSGASRSFRRSALERTRGGGIISKIIPDEQTNSLVVLANQAGFDSLLRLVGKLDVKTTDTGRIHVYYCEFAKAEDLASTLASLSQGGGGQKSTKKPTSSPTTPGSPPSTAPAGPSGPVTAELDGGIKITSDAPTNALVITANSADYQTLKRVIRKLDIPRLQVYVETALLEVAIGNNTNVGVNTAIGGPLGYAGGFLGDQADLVKYLTGQFPEGGSIPIFAGPSFGVPIPGGTTGAAGSTLSVNTFMGFLSLLTKTTNSSLLSTPQIIALDNEKAEFKVLDETPVQSNFTLLQGTAGAPTTGTGSIDRLKTGIEITLTPHVNAASKIIRLEIQQKVDSTKSSTAVPQALQGIQVATTSRVTNTTVVVKDQDLIVLGGLMSDKVDENINKVPLLGDIPILGWLFKSKSVIKTKTNLVILLHPRIIGNTLASAEVLKDKLKQREDFIKEGRDDEGPDAHKQQVDKLKKRVLEQEERGRSEPEFDYRNNSNKDEEEEDDKSKPGEKSELERIPKRDKEPATSTTKTGSLPLLPAPSDVKPVPDKNAEREKTYEIPPPSGEPIP